MGRYTRIIWILCLGLIANISVVNSQTKTVDLSKKYKKLLKKCTSNARSGNYDKAMVLVNKILKKYPDYAEGYMRKGSYFYQQGMYAKSATAMEKGIALDPHVDVMNHYSLGIVYRELERYADAVPHLEKYLAQGGGRVQKRAAKALAYCKEAADLVANPVPFDPQRLPESINSSLLEYTPLPSVDGESIVFTRRIGGQEDFYRAQKMEEGDYEVSPIEELNTAYNEGAHTLSADGQTMIYTACDYKGKARGCDLYISHMVDGKWNEPTPMSKAVNSLAWDAQPSLSSDGKTLYFSSDRVGGSGGRDIWFSRYHEEHGWSVARPLPAGINTPSNEESPFIHADGQTLYFRSNGHGGMGGYDIFYTRHRAEKKGWTKPQNIGYPINTRGDEGALTVSLDGGQAYFASDRDSRNSDRPHLDIYTFELYEEARPQPMTFVKAEIVDGESEEAIDAVVSMIDLEKRDTLYSELRAREGVLITPLPAYGRYACFVEKEGYAYHSELFETDTIVSALKPFHLKIKLWPLPPATAAEKSTPIESAPIILKNVFFETGSATLQESSMLELNKLLALTKQDPEILLVIVGHTDDVGSEADNLKLSKDRADAVVARLVRMGVPRDRLSSIGKGESEPIADNSNAEGRAMNRRTECIIKRKQI